MRAPTILLALALCSCSDARGYSIGPYDLSTMDAVMKVPRQDMDGNYLPIEGDNHNRGGDVHCAPGTNQPNC